MSELDDTKRRALDKANATGDPVDAAVAAVQARMSRPLTDEEVVRLRRSQSWQRPKAPVTPIRPEDDALPATRAPVQGRQAKPT